MEKLGSAISDIVLAQISELIAERIGLHFPKERWRDLERGIAAASREFGFKDIESCHHWLLSAPLSRTQIEILASYLTIGETYFFREKKSFEMLEKHVLPELIHLRRKDKKSLRIWSAACATGEEPYSIAIVLSRMIPDIRDWNITILATDINPRFLDKAIKGIYTKWSFRDTPHWVKENYFIPTEDGHFRLLPSIKKMATFSYQNLGENSYPSLLNNTNAMDIIFCRNVLMYFSHNFSRKVIQKLYHSLLDKGWLIVSPCETSHLLFPQFDALNFPDVIFYRKTTASHTLQDTRLLNSCKFQDASFKSSQQVQGASHTLQNENCTLQEIGQPSHEDEFIPEPAKEIMPSEPELTEENDEVRNEDYQQELYLEAVELYKKGFYAEVINTVEDLSLNNEGTSMTRGLLIRAFANQGRLSEASALCQRAIDADKLDPSLHYLLATILQEQGEIYEAIKSLKRSLYIDPDFVLAHFTLGNLTKQQGRLKESRKYFENALKLLHTYDNEDILLESEGINAGRLKEIIRLMIVD